MMLEAQGWYPGRGTEQNKQWVVIGDLMRNDQYFENIYDFMFPPLDTECKYSGYTNML